MIKKYFRARRLAKTKQEIQAKRDWFMKNHREIIGGLAYLSIKVEDYFFNK